MIFWGELPPSTITGVSISNSEILKILNTQNKEITIVEENSWKLGTAKKTLHYINSYIKLLSLFLKRKHKYFYFNLATSKFGLLKLFYLLPILKVLRPSTIFIAHIHRGDTYDFYKQSFLNRFLLTFVLRYINKLIVLSPTFKNQLEEIGFNKEIYILRNTSNFENLRNIYPQSYSNKYISITNYIETKGIIDLVKCFSEKEMAHLTLDTFGIVLEDNTYDKIVKIKPKNVTIHDSLIRSRFIETISKFDALILSSWNEGQPTIIIEAMSLGIPVISSNVGDIKNMLGEDYPFIFPARNIPSMKIKILEFHNYQEKNKISEKLKERYKLLFSNDIYKTNVITIFN